MLKLKDFKDKSFNDFELKKINGGGWVEATTYDAVCDRLDTIHACYNDDGKLTAQYTTYQEIDQNIA